MDATCLGMSAGVPSRVARTRRISDPEARRVTKLCQRLRKTCTSRQWSIVAVITTVSTAPAERVMAGSAPLRLKPVARRAEVFTGRLGAWVSLRLPLAAG